MWRLGGIFKAIVGVLVLKPWMPPRQKFWSGVPLPAGPGQPSPRRSGAVLGLSFVDLGPSWGPHGPFSDGFGGLVGRL